MHGKSESLHFKVSHIDGTIEDAAEFAKERVLQYRTDDEY